MKILNVPHTSITEAKSNPTKIFEQSAREKTGVYIFNRNNVAGVMLSKDQYEYLNNRVEQLEEEMLDLLAYTRLQDSDVKVYTDKEVRGSIVDQDVTYDENDGWE